MPLTLPFTLLPPRRTEWPQTLRSHELFKDCTNTELSRIAPLLTMITVNAGTVLMREGTIGLEFVMITDGTASVSVGAGPKSRVIADLGPGDFVGEMSLLGHNRRSATVTATSRLTFYVANTAEFSSLLDAAPAVGRRIMTAAAQRAQANAARAA